MINKYYSTEDLDVGIGATRIIEYVKRTEEGSPDYDHSDMMFPGHNDIGSIRIQFLDGSRVAITNRSKQVAQFRPGQTPFLITYHVEERPIYSTTISSRVTSIAESSVVVHSEEDMSWVDDLDLTNTMKKRLKESKLTRREVLNGNPDFLRGRLGSAYAVNKIRTAVEGVESTST